MFCRVGSLSQQRQVKEDGRWLEMEQENAVENVEQTAAQIEAFIDRIGIDLMQSFIEGYSRGWERGFSAGVHYAVEEIEAAAKREGEPCQEN